MRSLPSWLVVPVMLAGAGSAGAQNPPPPTQVVSGDCHFFLGIEGKDYNREEISFEIALVETELSPIGMTGGWYAELYLPVASVLSDPIQIVDGQGHRTIDASTDEDYDVTTIDVDVTGEAPSIRIYRRHMSYLFGQVAAVDCELG